MDAGVFVLMFSRTFTSIENTFFTILYIHIRYNLFSCVYIHTYFVIKYPRTEKCIRPDSIAMIKDLERYSVLGIELSYRTNFKDGRTRVSSGQFRDLKIYFAKTYVNMTFTYLSILKS